MRGPHDDEVEGQNPGKDHARERLDDFLKLYFARTIFRANRAPSRQSGPTIRTPIRNPIRNHNSASSDTGAEKSRPY